MDFRLKKLSQFDRLVYEKINEKSEKYMTLEIEEKICLYTSMGINSMLFKDEIKRNVKIINTEF
jgi:hypothetical protein